MKFSHSPNSLNLSTIEYKSFKFHIFKRQNNFILMIDLKNQTVQKDFTFSGNLFDFLEILLIKACSRKYKNLDKYLNDMKEISFEERKMFVEKFYNVFQKVINFYTK